MGSSESGSSFPSLSLEESQLDHQMSPAVPVLVGVTSRACHSPQGLYWSSLVLGNGQCPCSWEKEIDAPSGLESKL